MIAVQSSGSIVSASEVEPTTSANSAVTGLRSPVSRGARIFSTSGSGPPSGGGSWRVVVGRGDDLDRLAAVHAELGVRRKGRGAAQADLGGHREHRTPGTY